MLNCVDLHPAATARDKNISTASFRSPGVVIPIAVAESRSITSPSAINAVHASTAWFARMNTVCKKQIRIGYKDKASLAEHLKECALVFEADLAGVNRAGKVFLNRFGKFQDLM